MKSDTQSWQPSQWKWRWVTFFVVCTALIVFIVIGLSKKAPHHETQPATPIATSTSSTATPTVTTPSLSPSAPAVSTATIANLIKQADPAVRIYGSYPNKQGRTTLLNQLRSLVSPAALGAIKRQWAGPELKTASNSVTDVQYGQIAYTSPTMSSIDMTVYVKGKTVFSETPSTTFDVPVDVRFALSGTQWVISNITTPGFSSK